MTLGNISGDGEKIEILESALRAHTPQLAAGYESKMETVLLHFLALRRLLRDAQVAFPAACCRELQLVKLKNNTIPLIYKYR